jgi:hypothetical protein
MAEKPRILIADDLGNVSGPGKLRSRAVLEAGLFLGRRLGAALDLLYVEDFW